MVGAAGFEPAASWSRTKRAPELLHFTTPNKIVFPNTHALIKCPFYQEMSKYHCVQHSNHYGKSIWVWSGIFAIIRLTAIVTTNPEFYLFPVKP